MPYFLNQLVEALDGLDRSNARSVYRAFDEQIDDVAWLAAFLTAHRNLTEVCVVDAYDILTRSSTFGKRPEDWVRHAVIRSAAEMHPCRIAELSAIYERRGCSHASHSRVSPEVLKTISVEYPEVVLRLDVLCRFALVLRSVGKFSPGQSAAVLGCSEAGLEAAYCAGVEILSEFAREITIPDDLCQLANADDAVGQRH